MASRDLIARSLFAAAFWACGTVGAVSPISSADPLVAIDMNRNAIISDIVQVFGAKTHDGGAGAAALKASLEKLRADRLLAASLASSQATLDAIIAEGVAASPPSLAPTRKQALAVGGKQVLAVGDANRDLVYTPLTPCRLVDTRGNGAPIQGGPFAPPQTRRSYAPNGLCSIPTSGIATMLVSFTTQNLTPQSGGILAILAPEAPFTTTNDVFNQGAEWSASITAVATGPAGQFDVFVVGANAQVIIDILGYFAPPQGGGTGGGGTVTSIGTGPGLAGGPITTTGTISLATVAVANGGTGQTSLAVNGVLYGQGTNAIGIATGSAGQILAGTVGAPTWTDSPSLGGSVTLAPSTASAGNILKGTNRFIHNFGSNNTFIGESSGNFAMTGGTNTAIGAQALMNTTTGGLNTAGGFDTLLNNTTGSGNTAFGIEAMSSNTTGSLNTAIGHLALVNNTTGIQNIAIGERAGIDLIIGSNNIAIGSAGVAPVESSTIRIGTASTHTRAFVAGIRGVTTGSANAIPVLIDSNGQLGTASSSRRFKEDIADMDTASSALLELRPVTFHYKTDNGASGRTLQYGLIAEEVAEVYPGLVAHSPDGQVETVMYQYLPTMLLNEYQKQQRTIAAQSAELSRQTLRVAELEQDRLVQMARIDALEKQSSDVATLKRQVAQITLVQQLAARLFEGTASPAPLEMAKFATDR